jgi:hypothetical protein
MFEEKTVMKTGLIIALAVIVVRIVLEQAGAPQAADNIFGVAWLYFVLPVFFGLSIAARGAGKPYRSLLTDVFLFGVYTRVMVMVTYMLAYLFRWQAPRFLTTMGGNVGENVSFVNGFFVIPVRNALIWVVFATLVGMIIGGVTILVRRRRPAAAA